MTNYRLSALQYGLRHAVHIAMMIRMLRSFAVWSVAALFLVANVAWAGTGYTTSAASNITAIGATLNGTAATTCGFVSGIQFNYGLTAGYGSSIAASPSAISSTTVPVSANIGGLTCNTTYHYQLVGGTCLTTFQGADQTFNTGPIYAPTGVTAVAGAAQATVDWTAPASNCGSVITGYTVTSVQDPSKTCTSSGATSCVVTGLTNGSTYTFTVTATNGNGTGDVSSPSVAVTPKLSQAISFGATPTIAAGGIGTVSATATSGLTVTYTSTTLGLR